ncbi:TetR-like C-terminal domain-containing protein [Nocardia sp. JMUB6875]|uniref:TetR-like C-terminal domain-containing protein n=1 Tax=Nocardia sp. JMUB6875 TaxID=3158170 RepID=UPI0034E88132
MAYRRTWGIGLQWAEPTPDTGSLRSDLLALGETFMARDALRDAVQAGLLTAMARDDTVRAAMYEMVGRPRQQAFAAIVAQAHACGEISRPERGPDIARIFPAMTFRKLVLRKQPMDAAFVTHVVDDYILPLLTRD